MSSRFQTIVVLGSSLVYPNAVVWSEENLIAVACGSNVIILNPANPGVRGLIAAPSSNPVPLGVVDGGGQDLLSGCLLPCHLSRDTRPCVRSISWSPVGLSDNAGCLLAVCTVAGRVKLYRSPFCEFSSEWMEFVDISEMLFGYFTDTNFQDCRDNSAAETAELMLRRSNEEHEYATDLPVSDLKSDRKRRRQNVRSGRLAESMPKGQIVPFSSGKRLREKEIDGGCDLPLVSVQEYATRIAMLSSITVSWSPIMGTSGNGFSLPHDSFRCCSILAVGGKCGRVSFWRVRAPGHYSIVKCSHSSGNVTLVSVLKAHDSWVTGIDWAKCGSDTSSTSHLVLATGSSNGRVKIWQVNNGEKLLSSSDVVHDSFSLLKEIVTSDCAAISVLSIVLPSNSPLKLHVAIGEGSGSLEVWILDVPSKNSVKVSRYNVHDRVLTGLAWAFDGHCLYSCSQDNTVKCWILVGDSMHEVSVSSSNLGLKSSPDDVSSVFDSCFGLALSPGNLVLSVARGVDADKLNPMYEGKTHRAALEYIWIGGQQWDLPSSDHRANGNEDFPGSREKELMRWKSNILWSLNRYECYNRVLNVWDVVNALCLLKQSEPKHVERILSEWLTSCFGPQIDVSFKISSKTHEFLQNLSSRRLHLISIITRHVVLRECKSDDTNVKLWGEEQLNSWSKLLLSIEIKLLGRLVSLNFAAILRVSSDSSADSSDAIKYHCGLLQMKQWVSVQADNLNGQTKALAAEFEKVDMRRLADIFGCEANEQCSFCSASVPFEYAEYAICLGADNDGGASQRHKLERCATTMRVLPTKPSWYCICCKRCSAQLAPSILFAMHGYPSDFESFMDSYACTNLSVPRCPFCGILLQRLQPGHCISPSPV